MNLNFNFKGLDVNINNMEGKGLELLLGLVGASLLGATLLGGLAMFDDTDK